MYSLQLRRGIGRGRIWKTSLLCHNNGNAGESSHNNGGPHPRRFHSSPPEEAEGGNGNGRSMPKLSFQELMRQKQGNQQPNSPTPPSTAPVRPPNPTSPPPQQTYPPQSSASRPHSSPYDTAPQKPVLQSTPQSSSQSKPDDRQYVDLGSIMSKATSSAPRERERRKHRPAGTREFPDSSTEGLTAAERLASSQSRAYAQAHSLVPKTARDGPRGVDAAGKPKITFARSSGGNNPAARSFLSRGGGPITRGPGATGGRGRGVGGGRGARRGGRGGKQFEARSRADELSEEREEEVEHDKLTSDPQLYNKEGEYEPHPVYDTTKPYFAEVGDLGRWIPAVGSGGAGSRKLLTHQKPRHENAIRWGEKALLGDGIFTPGEAKSDEGGRILTEALRNVERNRTYLGRPQSEFEAILREKLGSSARRMQA